MAGTSAEGPRARGDEHRLEQVIGALLRAGVLVAAAVTLIGGATYLWQHGGARADYHAFHLAPARLRHVTSIVADALALQSAAIIQLGLVLLLATPIARVVLSWVAFALQRDWLYVGITSLVLAALLFGLLGGGG
jgi:uncharacterized membrane protein